MSNEPFAKGHCLCGAVSYIINAKPVRMAQCHCKDCQRTSGTGHMSLAFFKKEDVIIRGATASYASTADSGNINTRHFCPTCGSRVYGENSGQPGIIGITWDVSTRTIGFPLKPSSTRRVGPHGTRRQRMFPTSSGCHLHQSDLSLL